jgi:hypothetical protein
MLFKFDIFCSKNSIIIASFIAIGDNSNQINLKVIGMHIPFDDYSSNKLMNPVCKLLKA